MLLSCRCEQGCSCVPHTVDAHITLKQSTLYFARLLATAQAHSAEDCIVAVTVANDTSSGEQKFKVTGLMVSEFTNGSPEFEFPEMDGAGHHIGDHMGGR